MTPNSKQNILYIAQSGKPGGAEISMMLLLKALDKTQFCTAVVVPPSSPLQQKLQDLGVKTFGLSLPQIKPSNPFRLLIIPLSFIFVCFKLVKLIRRNRIGIIHSMSNKRTAAYSIVAGFLSGIPSVWTIRILDRIKIVDAFLLLFATKVIAISKLVQKTFDAKSRYDDKMVMIYNALDVSAHNLEMNRTRPLRKRWGFHSSDFLVANVGRLGSEKGCAYFLKAIEKVIREEPALRFVVVGDRSFYGNDDYYRTLLELSEDLGIQNQIKFVGFEANVPEIMSSIDLLVLCSENESFGRVVIEAMAMEKPAICFNSGGPKELIENGVTGVLIPPRDVDALAKAIVTLYRNKELRCRMGKLGRQTVVQKFNVANHVAAYQNVYKELLR